METRLGWGRETVPVPAAAERAATAILRPAVSTQPPADLAREARAAVAAACAVAGRGPSAAPPRSFLLVLPDRTRPAPLRAALAALWPALAERGIPPSRVRLAIASGSHRADPLDVSAERLGIVPRGVEILPHDPAAATDERGVTAAGTPVHVHPALAASDAILGVGGIAFHYFAGFGGGWKLFFPGLAARPAIAANHRLALGDDPAGGARPGVEAGRLDGNPVAEDLRAVARLLPPAAVWTLWDDGARSAIDQSVETFPATCERYARPRRVGTPAEAACVLASAGGWPRDADVVQSHKALRNAARYARPGGRIVLFAACPEGIGSDALEAWLARPDRATLGREAGAAYDLNAQTAISLAELGATHDVTWIAQRPLPALERFGFRVRLDPADAWRAAGEGAALLLPQAGEVLPAEAQAG